MPRIVISDTTAIIHLSRIRALHLLKDLYGEIIIPEAVYDELLRNGRSQPGAFEVTNASWIKVEPVRNPAVVHKLRAGLDLGESEAIALAIEKNADVLIIDEVAGRSVARQLGQRIIGMVGILLLAKKDGIIAEIWTYLDALDRTGFRLSKQVRDVALSQAGEAPRRIRG
jgi:uncharacterized protein